MKTKIFAIAALSIVTLGLHVDSSSAFGRHRWVTRITCTPYNAFSSSCYGRMTCVGCCPSLFAPQPSCCPEPCCPDPCHGPMLGGMPGPGCMDGNCGMGGPPAYVHAIPPGAPPAPAPSVNENEPPSYTPPMPTPVSQGYPPAYRVPYSVRTTAYQRPYYGYRQVPVNYAQQNYNPGYYQQYPAAPMQQMHPMQQMQQPMPMAPTMPIPYYWYGTPNSNGY